MKNRKIHRAIYFIRRRVLSINNLVASLALIVALGWVWGSLGVMQRNYDLQRTLRLHQQELVLGELEVRNLELENQYHKTREYQELAARQRLGLATEGEKVLILPPRIEDNSDEVSSNSLQSISSDNQPSNFNQWLMFFFGV